MAITFPKKGGSTTTQQGASTTTQQGGGVVFPKTQSATPDIKFTPGGARFTPFGLEEFVDLQDDTLSEAMFEQQIADDLLQLGLPDPSVGDFEPLSPDITAARDSEILANYNTFKNAEIDRIDSVLTEKLGDKWQGSRTKGPIGFTVTDGLVRRQSAGTFEDRQLYFKKHHPEGKYSRIPTGGGKFIEVYSLTPDGDVFAVDNVGLGTLPQTTGAITANVGNFTTVGSLVGTVFSPLIGTTVGASLGNLVDQAIADETSLNNLELLQGLDKSDAATIGIVDGLIAKFLPGLGGKLKQGITGESGASILARKTSGPQALKAQQAAERLELPLFGAAQLATDNKLIQAAFTQTAGTSSIPGRLINKQQRALFERLKQKAQSDFDSFTAEELSTYTKLQQDELAEQVYQLVANKFGGTLPEGMTLEGIERSIRDSASKLQVSHNELIDEAYKKAFNTAGSDSVVFDLTPLKSIARDIQLGTQIRTTPKRVDKAGRAIDAQGRLIPTPTTRAEGELSGELKEITNALINVLEPKVSKLVVKDQGKQKSFDALSQLKGLRDRASRLMNDQNDSKSAKLIVDAIDEILENPVGGSKEFLKYYDEAKTLVKLKSDTLNASNIASMFSRKSDVMPNELAEKFWTGQFSSRDWDYFTKMAKGAAGNRPDAKIAAQQLIADVQDGFITWLYQNPAKTQERIRTIMEADSDLFAKIVPDIGDRKALENISQKSSWLQSDGVQAAMKRDMTVGERALKSIESMTEKEMIDFINKNGGIDGKAATQMRAAVFNRVLEKVSDLDKQDLNIVDVTKLRDEFNNLLNFNQQAGYGNLKPLFQSATVKNDIPTYDGKTNEYIKDLMDNRIYASFLAGFQIDAGGQIQAASAVAGLARLEFQAFKTIFTNNVMANIFASPPSVSQLKKVHGGGAKTGIQRFWNRRKGNVFANILGQLGDKFSKDVETPKEEVKRTGQPPQMGDDLSEPTASVSPSITPTPPVVPTQTVGLNLPPLPLASTPTRSGTNYDSLFPRDDIGSAIANRNRSGIMALT
tara:strand:- start:16290 stop:19394 length:3105 start_codon:yes stop_codon:yes gene_type:complete